MYTVVVLVVIALVAIWLYMRTSRSEGILSPTQFTVAQTTAMPGPTQDATLLQPVAIYDSANYTGKMAYVRPGMTPLGQLGMQGAVTSVIVPRGQQVSLFTNADCTGKSVVLRDNAPKLGSAINNKAKCIVVARAP